ncbi:MULTISPECIES: MBL fold metallo-hydrolase [unclassified Streptomyces]|uniref:MBL fold metallo-hydrolase n=1 Tax=unclassified Streptomyces TaxID=2593676 RepID=UPI00336ABA1C
MEPDAQGLPGLLIDALPHTGYAPRTYRVEPLTVHRTLQDGDVIDLGGRALTVLRLPGHTPGCIALLEERTGALFTGDVIYNGHRIDDFPESDPRAYRRSLALLADLDISTAHPGQGRSFDGHRLRELAHNYLSTPYA